jgi:hypothetical protein
MVRPTHLVACGSVELRVGSRCGNPGIRAQGLLGGPIAVGDVPGVEIPFPFTASVGSYRPNAWGLYDMRGNVWEWCGDGCAANDYRRSPVDDPAGAAGAALGVYRGCGYYDHRGHARSAVRYPRPPGFRSNVVRFRVALDPPDRR